MRRSGWKTALPVFLLGATLSSAVYAVGGLGVDGLSRAIPEIAPVPDVSPFAVVDGVAVAAPDAPDVVTEQSLLAFNRVPQAPSRADGTRPRPRPVMVAGETVPIDPPDAEVQPRARRDADGDGGRSRGRRDDAVAPDAAGAPKPAHGDKREDKSKPGKADEFGKSREASKGERDDEAGGKSRRADDEAGKRVHTASADGDHDKDDDAGRGEGRDDEDDNGERDGDAKDSDAKDSKGSGGDVAKSRRD